MLGVILAAEGIATWWMSRVEPPHTYETVRNPHCRRDWINYTQPRDRGDTPLVIVVGNSQAFAPEIADEELIYTAVLERRLHEFYDPSVKVANWSAGGISGPEMLMLCARAAQHKPEVLVLVTHSRPFSRPRVHNELDFYNTDINQLAYLPEVRELLPNRFIRHHEAYHPTNAASAHLSLIQAHNLYVEPRRQRWSEDFEPPKRQPRRRSYGAPRMDNYGRWLIRQCVHIVRQQSPETRILLVNMPLAQWYIDELSYERFVLFERLMRRETARVRHNDLTQLGPGMENVVVLQGIRAVPGTWFYSATHMKPDGHTVFGRWLQPYVQAALAGEPITPPGDDG